LLQVFSWDWSCQPSWSKIKDILLVGWCFMNHVTCRQSIVVRRVIGGVGRQNIKLLRWLLKRVRKYERYYVPSKATRQYQRRIPWHNR
jgi:hypothetical protein